MKLFVALFCSLAATVLFAEPAKAQQPGTAAYNSVFLPAIGAGDTRSRSYNTLPWAAAAGDTRQTPPGVTWGAPDEATAEAEAMQLCRDNGGVSCRIITTFQNRCIAIGNSGDDSFPWATASTLNEVRSDVRRRCARDGERCEIAYQRCQ